MRLTLASLLTATLTLAASFEVQVTGTAPRAMILIPGLASSGDVWESTVAHHRNRYQCHTLTLAGFAGVAPEKSDRPLLDRVVSGLAAYIEEKKLQRPIVVGHSLGGVVAMAFAAKHPGLAGELVIIDSLPHLGEVFGPGYDPAKFRDAMLKQTREQYDAFVRSGASLRAMVGKEDDLPKLIDWSLRSDPAAVAHAMYEISTTNLTGELPKIQSRALVIGTWIAMKSFAKREEVEGNFRRQYAGLAGHRFLLSDTARHFVMFDDPAWLFAQMDAFLR